ncbi:MAG: dTMP kinase [Gemmatimonadetes bacterium]|nr:dTMP kinase [Gemmatimonadota bacterium]
MFLTFEGIEGSGKSTQCSLLRLELERLGYEVVLSREPGGIDVPASEAIRSLLLDPKQRLCPRAELLLFQASRAQHVDQLIRPALARGAVVVCDRFYHASVAYQGGGRGVSLDSVVWLNEFATGGLRPDHTILLDVEAGIGIQRARARSGGRVDRIERESIDFHERVRAGYLRQARAEPESFLLLDGTLSPDALGERIAQEVRRWLESGNRKGLST